jgi:hypothetical protein
VKTALACLAGVLALATGVHVAWACDCVPPDPDVYLQQYPAAFVGRLVETRANHTVYVFAVEQAVKGDLGDTVEVVSAAYDAACGLEGRNGRRVGVFLRRKAGHWESSSCLQIAPAELERAAVDAGLTVTGPGAEETPSPSPQAAEPGPSSGDSRVPEILAGAAILAGAGVLLMLVRRRLR